MGGNKRVSDTERAANKKAFSYLYFENKRLKEISIDPGSNRTCSFCCKEYSKRSFQLNDGQRPSLVCRSCLYRHQLSDIVEKLSISNTDGCILWPENDRSTDYYSSLRRRLFGRGIDNKDYLHVRCNDACLNESHIFRYKSGFAPLWYRLGLNKEFDLSSLSDSESFLIKAYLKSKVTIDERLCWKSGDWQKDGTFRIGDAILDTKKLFYEIFIEKIIDADSMLAHRCGTTNCVNPEHLELFKSKYGIITFWARFGLAKPDVGFDYCQNEGCEDFGQQILLGSLNSFVSKNGKYSVTVCPECFSDKDALFKKRMLLKSRNNHEIGKRDTKFITNIIKKYDTCCYCGRDDKSVPIFPGMFKRQKFQLEHIIPIMGEDECGTNDNSNLEHSCWQCNNSKGSKSVELWLKKIKLWINKTKDNDKLSLYKLNVIELEKPGTFIDGKFIARHMRNKK